MLHKHCIGENKHQIECGNKCLSVNMPIIDSDGGREGSALSLSGHLVAASGCTVVQAGEVRENAGAALVATGNRVPCVDMAGAGQSVELDGQHVGVGLTDTSPPTTTHRCRGRGTHRSQLAPSIALATTARLPGTCLSSPTVCAVGASFAGFPLTGS